MQRKTLICIAGRRNQAPRDMTVFGKIRNRRSTGLSTIDAMQLYRQADKDVMARRLDKFDREWDMERILETNASSIVIFGVLMGVFVIFRGIYCPFLSHRSYCFMP